MQYRVKIVVTEIYSTWVEADNDEAAEEIALKQLNDGDLALDYESVTTNIVDTDED